jgi:hypothetical protein
VKKDNSTYEKKVALRLNARESLGARPVVLETHGGYGRLYQRVYSDLPRGVVFETDQFKAASLAGQRPGWSVYQAVAEDALAAGVGFHLRPNLFDLDPYGSPWNVVGSIFARSGEWGEGPAAFVVNDGMRQKLRMHGGWHCRALAAAVAQFGNGALFARYLEVCRWLVDGHAARVGRRVVKWAGYHCGPRGDMTHYAFVLA